MDDTIVEEIDFALSENSETFGILRVGDDKFELKSGRIYTIGRSADCDICISEPCISRSHASIEIIDGYHFLTDRSSKSGTFREKHKLVPCHEFEIYNGSNLKFGSKAARYEIFPVKSDFAKPAKIRPSCEPVGYLFLESTPTNANNSLVDSASRVSAKTFESISSEYSSKALELAIAECSKSPDVVEGTPLAFDSNDDAMAIDSDLEGTKDTIEEAGDDDYIINESNEAILTEISEVAEQNFKKKHEESVKTDSVDKDMLFSVPPVGMTTSATSVNSVHWQPVEIIKANIEKGAESAGDLPLSEDGCSSTNSKTVSERVGLKLKKKKILLDENDEVTEEEGLSEVHTKHNLDKNHHSPRNHSSKQTAEKCSETLVRKSTISNETGTPAKKSARKSSRKEQVMKNDGIAKDKLEDSVEELIGCDGMRPLTASRTSSRKANARRPAMAARDAKILVTGRKENSTKDLVKQLNAHYVEDEISNCTHLVVDGPAQRTIKFVSCLGHGIPIVGVDWLKESVVARRLVDFEDFPPEDINVLESTFNFNLLQTRNETKRRRLLEGFSVYALANTTKLTERDIKAMVKSAGGKLMSRCPKAYAEDTVVICGDAAVNPGSDKKKSAVTGQPIDISNFVALNIPVVSSEFLLGGILRYDSDPSHFPVEIPVIREVSVSENTEPKKQTAKSRKPTAVAEGKKASKRKTIKSKSENS